jgi:hypothetical protein
MRSLQWRAPQTPPGVDRMLRMAARDGSLWATVDSYERITAATSLPLTYLNGSFCYLESLASEIARSAEL